ADDDAAANHLRSAGKAVVYAGGQVDGDRAQELSGNGGICACAEAGWRRVAMIHLVSFRERKSRNPSAGPAVTRSSGTRYRRYSIRGLVQGCTGREWAVQGMEKARTRLSAGGWPS